jgi:hypothetical protein
MALLMLCALGTTRRPSASRASSSKKQCTASALASSRASATRLRSRVEKRLAPAAGSKASTIALARAQTAAT